VDAVMTLINQPIDILNAYFACVSQLQRASRLKATSNNAKHNRVEERLVFSIEWTVDENTTARRRWHSGLAVLDDQENVFARTRSDPRPILFRVSSLQFCDFSDSFSDHSFGNGSVPLDIADWSVFSRRHA
jgi:hypothetical protein